MEQTEATQTQAVTNAEPEFAALVGIDWADKKHYWSLSTPSGRTERGTLDNTPEAVELRMAELRLRFQGRPVAVALEQRKGTLIVMLSKYDHLYLYPVHPRTVSKFREALYPSGAKDDTKDADLLQEILAQHRNHLRPLAPDTKEMRILQAQVENRRKLVDERTALANKLKDTLKISFPQVLRWFSDVSTEVVCDLLTRWPTLEDLRKARPATVEKFFQQHHCREESIRQRLDDIKNAVAATGDAAIVNPSRHMIAAWIGQMGVLRQSIREMEKEIGDLARQQEDWNIFDSFPGAGDVMAPRLMAAMGTSRERFDSAASLESPLRGESTAVLCRHCAGKGSQWKKRMDSFPPGVSEVPPPDVSRMGSLLDSVMRLGAGLLRSAQSEGQEPSHGGSGSRLQMDEDPVPLLETS